MARRNLTVSDRHRIILEGVPVAEKPFFDTAVPANVTGLVGKTAYLNCRVKNLGNRTVSVTPHLTYTV